MRCVPPWPRPIEIAMMTATKVWDWLRPWLYFLGLLAVAEAIIRISGTPEYLLPTPSAVVVEACQRLPMVLPHLGITMSEALIGFVAGNFCAIRWLPHFFLEKWVAGLLRRLFTFARQRLSAKQGTRIEHSARRTTHVDVRCLVVHWQMTRWKENWTRRDGESDEKRCH